MPEGNNQGVAPAPVTNNPEPVATPVNNVQEPVATPAPEPTPVDSNPEPVAAPVEPAPAPAAEETAATPEVSEKPAAEEVKDEKKKALAYQYREAKLKYNMRALCVIDEVYKILEEAINEGINEYKLMYAYDEQLYTMGYENKGKYVFAVWCPDGTVRTFESIEEMKGKVTLGHSVTILREFLTGKEGKAIEVSIEDNFMLKPFMVHNNSKDYNTNMSEPIADAMQKLADAHVERIDSNGKSTVIIVAIIVIILLILLYTVFK